MAFHSYTVIIVANNYNSSLYSVISHSGLESSVNINRILTKQCRGKLGGPIIMEHRAQSKSNRNDSIGLQ